MSDTITRVPTGTLEIRSTVARKGPIVGSERNVDTSPTFIVFENRFTFSAHRQENVL